DRLHHFGASCSDQTGEAENLTFAKIKTDVFKTRSRKPAHFHNGFSGRLGRAEMFVKGKIAARHGADQIGFGDVFDMAAFNLRTITKNRIIIADLKDFFHFVADENNRMIAVKKTTNDLEDTLDFNTRQR